MADEVLNISLNVDAGNSAETLETLKQKVAGLRQELESKPIGSAEFKALQAEITTADSKLKTLNTSLQGISTKELGLKMVEFAGGVTQMVSSIALLAGSSSDNMVELQKQLQKYIAVITLAGSATRVYEGATMLATIAQKALTTAMKANPWGLALSAVLALATALVVVAANYDTQTEAQKKASTEAKLYLEIQTKAADSAAKQITTLTQVQTTLLDVSKKTGDYKTALEKLDKELGTSLATETDINFARQKALLLIPEKIKLINLESQALASQELLIEKTKTLLIAKAAYDKADADMTANGGALKQEAMEDAYDAQVKAQEEQDYYLNKNIELTAEAEKATTDFDAKLKELGLTVKKTGSESVTATAESTAEVEKYTDSYSKLIEEISNYEKQLKAAITDNNPKLIVSISELLKSLYAQKAAIEAINEAMLGTDEKPEINTDLRTDATDKYLADAEEKKRIRDGEYSDEIMRLGETLQVKRDMLKAFYEDGQILQADYNKAVNTLRAEELSYYGGMASSMKDIGNSVFEFLDNISDGNTEKAKKRQKAAFNVNKATSAVETGINTLQAIMKIPATVPPPFAIPLQIATGIQGAATIAAILSKKFPNDGGGADTSSTAPAAPAISSNPAGGAYTPNNQTLFSSGGGTPTNFTPFGNPSVNGNQPPTMVYVLESDITKTQKNVSKVEVMSTF